MNKKKYSPIQEFIKKEILISSDSKSVYKRELKSIVNNIFIKNIFVNFLPTYTKYEVYVVLSSFVAFFLIIIPVNTLAIATNEAATNPIADYHMASYFFEADLICIFKITIKSKKANIVK